MVRRDLRIMTRAMGLEDSNSAKGLEDGVCAQTLNEGDLLAVLRQSKRVCKYGGPLEQCVLRRLSWY